MPAERAAPCALAASRLAMATRSARVAARKPGRRRLLILATPRMPQRSFAVGAMVLGSSRERFRVPGSLYNSRSRLTRTGPKLIAGDTRMCLLALFFHAVDDTPVVVGANRDEFYARGGDPPRLLPGTSRGSTRSPAGPGWASTSTASWWP